MLCLHSHTARRTSPVGRLAQRLETLPEKEKSMSRSLMMAAACALLFAQITAAQPVNDSSIAAQQDGMAADVGVVIDAGGLESAAVAPAEDADAEFKQGEVLLAFHPGVGLAQADAVRQEVSATQIKEFPRIGVHHWRLPPGLTVEQAITALSAHPNVRYAEPNFLVRANVSPADPYFNSAQWPLNNTGSNGGTPDADIDAPEAWDVQTGSADVLVAVIDSGIDYTHEDLAANIWVNPGETLNGIDDDGNGYVDDIQGWDFANNDNDPFDDRGHGTHVAGIIGARGNNGIGIAGVNWTVTLMPLKFLDAAGFGSIADAIEAVQYAASFDVPITNHSWGTGQKSRALEDAIAASGALTVASAGNDASSRKQYPAGYGLDNIISVASTDKYDELASSSNYSTTWVHLAAPGVSVFSTVPTGNCALCTSFGYLNLSGTSMAAPHVAGVAALLMAEDPEMDILTIRDRILASVDPLPSLAGKTVTGGRLNAFNAIPHPPDIIVTPVDELLTTEAGQADVFSVVLYAQPAADVTIDLASSDLTEGTVWPASLTFTPLNWDVPQQVIVTGVDDVIEDGNVAYTVLTAPAVSADPGYDGLDAPDLSATNLDDEGTRAQDGSIVAWGRNGDGEGDVPPPNMDFIAVAAGGRHSLGLAANGSVAAWGLNNYGQCDVPGLNSDFVAIAGGAYHSLGVKSGGSIVAWGADYYEQSTVPDPNEGFVSASAGVAFSVGLKDDGTIVGWGWNGYGSLDIPVPNSDFVAVAAGGYHCLGLKVDGTIVAWGAGDCQQPVGVFPHDGQSCMPGPNGGFVAMAAGGHHSLGLTAGGSIVAWGRNDSGQCDVPEPNDNFVAIAAGGSHSLGVKADGSIVSWGSNHDGQLIVPAPNNGFVAVAGGAAHSLGLVGLPPEPGISVTPTLGLVTTEAGGTAAFSVVLRTQPMADVSIDLASSDLTEGIVAPVTLVFTALDWDLPQQVTVTGVDDAIVDGDILYSIVTAPALSADPDYSGLDAADVAVTNLDDAEPEVCGNGSCANGEDQCNCPEDCGSPPISETNCTDGEDEDCDGNADCDDADCAADPACQTGCDNDGTCEPGEDCLNCPNDCDGKQNGPPSGRYCCGNGVLEPAEGNGSICDGNP